MSPGYTVIWDGRRSGPGGAFLFVEPETPAEAGSLPRYRTRQRVSRAQVAASITKLLDDDGPLTMRELCQASGFSVDRVNRVLYIMRRRGQVVVAGERPRVGSGGYGRDVESLYGLPRSQA